MLGVVNAKKEPLIPYDKDMTGCVVINGANVLGTFVNINFSNGVLDSSISMVSANITCVLTPAS